MDLYLLCTTARLNFVTTIMEKKAIKILAFFRPVFSSHWRVIIKKMYAILFNFYFPLNSVCLFPTPRHQPTLQHVRLTGHVAIPQFFSFPPSVLSAPCSFPLSFAAMRIRKDNSKATCRGRSGMATATEVAIPTCSTLCPVVLCALSQQA
jgi:hypothetical protein